ncbi:MAG: hypothetical protein ACI9MC_002921 [Kiritimatiellia bacterium]|jgi:hypothetical protein
MSTLATDLIYSVQPEPTEDLWAVRASEICDGVQSFPLVVDPSVDHELWDLPIAPLFTQTMWMVRAVWALCIGIVFAMGLLTVGLGALEVWAAVAVLAPVVTACSILVMRSGGSRMRAQANALARHGGFTTEVLRLDALGVSHEGTHIRWSELVLSSTQLSSCCMVELFGDDEHILLPMALESAAVDRILDALGQKKRHAVGALAPVDEAALYVLECLRERPSYTAGWRG